MAGREFSREEKEVLISEVQTRTFLGNDKEKDFKNLSLTRKAWEEIEAKLNISGDAAKSKWKNLKDKFRKEVQKLPKTTSGSEAKTAKSAWAFFDAMLFVRDVVLPGRTVGNLNLSLQDTTSTSGTSDLGVSEPVIVSDDEVSVNTSATSDVTSKPRGKKRKLDTFDQKMLELEEKKMDLLIKEQQQREDWNDPDYCFLMTLLPHLKRLSAVQKLKLQSTLLLEVLKVVEGQESDERD